jgi:serine protease Do
MDSDNQENNAAEYAHENEIPTQGDVDGARPSKLSRFNLIVTTFTFLLLIIGIVYGWGPVSQYRNTDPKIDGYVQPRSIADLVDLVQDSTVSIYCEYGTDGDYELGSGWALDIETDMESDYPTALVTNYHVIENCLNDKGEIFVEALEGKRFPAVIDNWDVENDLAVIATKLKIKPLELSQSNPSPGYWVMAVGTADGYEGSVAFGNVLNITDTEVLITAAISSGNSGGPLVDNEGKVIGTNSWSAVKEQYNGAKSLDAMCIGIMECDGKTYWKWD